MVLAKATPDPLFLLSLEAVLPQLVLFGAVQQQPPVGCVSCVRASNSPQSLLTENEGIGDI